MSSPPAASPEAGLWQVDGARGEGGGQVLRTALAVAMVTGRPLRVSNVRAGRKKPGLMRQHLTAVQAAATLCRAQLAGAEIGSGEVTFTPGPVVAGEHRFAVGTAGSTTLILQTVLPALLTAPAPSRLVLEGGTHNPAAPPYEFFASVLVPLLARMGARVEATLERAGFYPAGGGRLAVEITPTPALRGFELLERGEIEHRSGTVLLANLPGHIARREIAKLIALTGWDAACFAQRQVESAGPGNVVLLELASEHVTEVFTAFGELGVSAEKVAARAVEALRRYLAAGVPVGEHLADQLLLPLALAGGGAFRTLALDRHATTLVELLPEALPVRIDVTPEAGGRTCRVDVAPRG